MAQAVKATRNSIGYVEHAQATQARLAHALLENRAGRFVRPETASFQAAAANADWAGERLPSAADRRPGEPSYPITATVFVLMPTTGARARTRAALEFFRWSLEKGSGIAAALGYVALPPSVVAQVKAYWTATFKTGT